MTSIHRALARACAATLPALALSVAVPGVAHADSTLRYDDGARETSVLVNGWNGSDSVYEQFVLPTGTTHGSTSATLWMYGRATDCDQTGFTHTVTIGYSRVRFEPCATWPTTFAWHAFDIPLGWLNDGSVYVQVTGGWQSTAQPDGGPGSGSNMEYGIDTSADVHSSVLQVDYTGNHVIAGELMWYFTFTGSVPSMAVPTTSLDFALQAVGTTSPAQTVTVTNDGLADLEPTVSVTGDFAVTNDGCTGATVASATSCTFGVTFTPTTAGSRDGTATVSAPGVPSRTIALYGESPAPPPHTTIATANGAVLLIGDPVRGTVTSVSRFDFEWVTFTPRDPGAPKVETHAVLSCDTTRTACDWSAGSLLTPGRYSVTAHGVDVQGNVEPATAPIQVIVI